MKRITELTSSSKQVTADIAMKSTLSLAKPRMKQLLENLVKYPKSRGDYLDFKHEFEKFYSIISFISLSPIENSELAYKAEKYETFYRQFTVYEKAMGNEQSTQLKKLCEVADSHLGIQINQKYIDQIDNELSFDLDNLPF